MMNNTDLYEYSRDYFKLFIVSHFVSCWRRQVSNSCTASYPIESTGSSFSSTTLSASFFTNHPTMFTPVELSRKVKFVATVQTDNITLIVAKVQVDISFPNGSSGIMGGNYVHVHMWYIVPDGAAHKQGVQGDQLAGGRDPRTKERSYFQLG